MAISIGSYDINNGVLLRTQDIGALKSSEDIRPQVQQFDMQYQTNKTEANAAESVQQFNNAENPESERKFDARDKGSNKYEYFGSRTKKKAEDGKVRIKDTHTGFDVSV